MPKTAILGQQDLLLAVVNTLTKHTIPYLLTGSFAVSYYGYPRATHDIDFVIEIQRTPPQTLIQAIKALGKGFLWDPKDVEHANKDTIVMLYHADTAIKIDLWIIDASDFDQKQKRGHVILLENQHIPIISAEDLILTKLSWCKDVASERHKRDCIGIWKVQKGRLDEVYLHKKAAQLEISNLLAQVASDKEY